MDEQFNQQRLGRTYHESDTWFDEPRQPRAGSPNIIYVILDDVGYADLGCFGSEIKTPNFDRLAKTGLRYSNFHTTTMCSPTRACMLTGRNHHSVGMRFLANFDFGYPSGRGCISHRAATIAEILGDQGYATFAIGKWHLAQVEETSAAGPFDQWPLGRGFQRFYGFMNGSTDQYHPELIEDNHAVDPPATPSQGYHLTADMIDQAIKMIGAQTSMKPENPFFLNLGFSAGHFPHQVAPEWMDKYDGIYDQGWDKIREARLARQKEMGLVPDLTELPPPNPEVERWHDLNDDTKKVAIRMQQAYAGFLEYTDAQFGRLMQYLEEIGKADNTMVVLISDNGASCDTGPVGTTNVIRRFNQVPDTTEENLKTYDEIGSPRYFGNYPWGWAQASNTPLRLYKSFTHGGGVRDPLIVSWPKGITNAGRICHQFHHVVDVMPTVLEICQISPPETYKGVAQIPVHGTSFAYTFEEPEAEGRKEIQYFEMFGHRGLWHKGWKAVTNHTKGEDFEADDWELYNLSEDFNETENLAKSEPEKLREMRERWWAEAGRYDVMPLDDREVRFRPISKPGGIRNRKQFIYYPEVDVVPGSTAPVTGDCSHVIIADVVVTPQSEGALVSFGNSGGGYVFYIKDNCLIYTYNYCGQQTVLKSEPLNLDGEYKLGFSFEKTKKLKGIGKLTIDEKVVAEGKFEDILIRPTLAALYIGRTGQPPACDTIEGEFPFTGTLKSITYDLKSDNQIKPPDPHVD